MYLFSSGNERLAKQKTKLATRAVDPAFYDRMHFKDVDLEKKYLQVDVDEFESIVFASFFAGYDMATIGSCRLFEEAVHRSHFYLVGRP